MSRGLSRGEIERALTLLGRTPNEVEWAVLGVLWSEHCSYKSSRLHLARLPTHGPGVVQGPGENAGVIDAGDGLVLVFKMESHNHPSFIEPEQGAATGVGGILRDVFTMGARPLALLDALRFGRPEADSTARLLRGVVRGIGGYGNCIGVPTVGGDLAFDAGYGRNILVNVMAVGVARAEDLCRGRADGPGNLLLSVGAPTGRDGIHGATMASAAFEGGVPAERRQVQVGDPFTGKKVMEACLEAARSGLLVGMQDMGAAGLTSSAVEMAARAGTGLEIDLDAVAVRVAGMTPVELLLSESQERMLWVCSEADVAALQAIARRWDVPCVAIGRVTTDARFTCRWHGETVVDLPIHSLVADAPLYDRPQRQPAPADPSPESRPTDPLATLQARLAAPDFAEKRWIYEQLDSQVGAGTVLGPEQGSAAVLRLPGSRRGVAIALGCDARRCSRDPFEGASAAVIQAALAVACTGARPAAVTDCLNFASPERPEVMWSFARAIDGISAACHALDLPVVSGNVSFYNETDGAGIDPTPMVGVVGLLDDVARTRRGVFERAGLDLVLLGGDLSTARPVLDLLAHLHALDRLFGARVLGRGGLAVAVVRSGFTHGIGAHLNLAPTADLAQGLFGDGDARVLVATSAPDEVRALARRAAVAEYHLGRTGGDRLIIDRSEVRVLDVDLTSLRQRWDATLPALARGR